MKRGVTSIGYDKTSHLPDKLVLGQRGEKFRESPKHAAQLKNLTLRER